MSAHQAAPLNVELMHPNNNQACCVVQDADMMPPTGDATLLFAKAGHTAVMAPDGHHITLGEFNRVSGYASIKCINKGTHVVIHLSGLIPNGVYTIWVVSFKSPGYEATLANLIGVGALGAGDGSKNSFTASAAGTGSLSAIMPAGSLSEFGSVNDCLSTEYQVQLLGAYHIDGLTHGGSPGDESTWVEQFVFQFMGAQL
ncbi:MAG: hypothetical protein ABIR81_04040 [Ginsengibacter sp.]